VNYREKAMNRPIQTKRGRCLVDESFAPMCDINTIAARFLKTGELPLATRQGFYADTSYLPTDLLAAHEVIREASESFMQIPAKIRERFNNDPSQLLAFVQDPSNREQAIELGLIPKPSQEPPKAPSVVPPTTPPTPVSKPPKKASPAPTTTTNDDE